ncbi:hypothetical protein ACTWP5_03045 [Streptomyces sp. 4N509B]|uniref:hypothetical protein n=1 Tax=Streptomyces sp. 4N509B TaxID=3457413 RepID=UPI003FD2FE9F
MPTPSPIPHGSSDAPDVPRPAPIRFFGTCWVDHSRGYAPRRVLLGAAALLLAAAGGLVLWLVVAGVGAVWLRVLVGLALALSTAMAFTRTWGEYTEWTDEEGAARAPGEPSFRSIKIVGFVGLLLAYGLRSTVEAPGERARRAAYEAAVERHHRTIAKRSGNPARRRTDRRRR